MEKSIMLCIRNRLIADGVISLMSKKNDKVKLFEQNQPKFFESSVLMYSPEVIVIEVKDVEPYTLREWKNELSKIKHIQKNAKIAMIVDDDNYPGVTDLVKAEKASGAIDAFFYASSGLNYLVDAIDSL